MKDKLETPKWLFSNCAKRLAQLWLITIAYYVVGRLALLLGIPPVFAAAVWPAAGIALAVTLLIGYRAWPAILVGSFLVNISTYVEIPVFNSGLAPVMLAVSVGIGAVLQAIAGAFLIKRFGQYPTMFVSARNVIKFLIIAGPLSCLVSASWGVSNLLLAGLIQGGDFLFHWWTWWAGDCLGVMTVTPLVLIWSVNKPAAFPRRRQILVSVPMVFAFILVTFFFVHTRASEQDRITLLFSRQTDRVARQVRDNFENYNDILYSVKGIYESGIIVDRSQFKKIASHWFSRYPGIRGLSWNPRIPAAERAKYEEGAKLDGFGKFQITENNSQGAVVVAAARAEYFPVYLLESVSGAGRAIGFDVASDPVRREALNQARDSANPWATPQLRLQGGAGEPGFLVYLPVYRPGGSHDTLIDRRLNLMGYVSGAFRIHEIMDAVVKSTGVRNIQWRLFDVTSGEPQRLLYDYRMPAAKIAGSPLEAATEVMALKRTVTLEIAGRRWIFQFIPTKEYFIGARQWDTWGVLAAGLIFTGLIGAFLLAATGQATQLQAVNIGLKKEIADRKIAEEARSQSETRKGAILESALDCIITTDPLGQIVEFNPAAEATFGYRRDEVMGKLISELVIPPSLRQQFHRALAQYFSGPDGAILGKRIEMVAMRADGTEFPVELAVTRVPLPGLPLFTGYLRDITQRKAAEEKINRYAVIVDSLDEAIIGSSWGGGITTWNKGAESMYGYAAEEVIGRSISLLHPPAQPDELSRLRQKLERGEPVVQYETIRVRKDGTQVQVSVTLSPIKDETGNIIGVASVSSDITARKRAETELQRQREDVAGRLHDSVAQSLTALSMHAELATSQLEDNPATLKESLHKMKQILRAEQCDLRAFLHELKGAFRPDRCDTHNGIEVLQNLTERLEIQWGLSIESRIDERVQFLSGALVENIGFMIQEGVANAARHGHASSINIATAFSEAALFLSIVDNGRGFPFRGEYDDALLTAHGIGPMMLRSRVASLGGSVTLRSGNCGACLEISLPSVLGSVHVD